VNKEEFEEKDGQTPESEYQTFETSAIHQEEQPSAGFTSWRQSF
jgi:hypothetical protein